MSLFFIARYISVLLTLSYQPFFKTECEEGLDNSELVVKLLRTLISKVDILAMNQERLNRNVVPGEKVIKRPTGLPPFPIHGITEAKKVERFLKNDNNKAAAVSHLYSVTFITFLVKWICGLEIIIIITSNVIF